ncbi:MAG: hypothetical protein GX813_02270, partial [Erysipelotrichia bacterium]|nr:hypothetical protein [Erysipelotrichia bacterium]
RYDNKLGSIKDKGSELIIYDRYGNRCGSYDKRNNTTKDRQGNKVGTGNLLALLLSR